MSMRAGRAHIDLDADLRDEHGPKVDNKDQIDTTHVHNSQQRYSCPRERPLSSVNNLAMWQHGVIQGVHSGS